MSLSSQDVQRSLDRALRSLDFDQVKNDLLRPQELQPEPIPHSRTWSAQALKGRQDWFAEQFPSATALFEPQICAPELLQGNVENHIGWSCTPLGLAGPLNLRGTGIKQSIYFPMATTEGALIASFSRGAKAINSSGGALSLCLSEGVQRTPCFLFENALDAIAFVRYLTGEMDQLKQGTKNCSGHAELSELRFQLEGAMVTVIFEYTTGDAAGQNMVTFCTEALIHSLLQSSPVQPRQWYIEGNLSGDKKASSISLHRMRGKKVVAEVELNASSLRALSVDADQMMRYWELSAINGILSGSVGVNGHFANGLAALMLATGQDMACVGEASIGCTRMEKRGENLYVSVSLPNLILGTVGGGTALPSAKAALELLGCLGEGKARRLAEIAGALALCGEISIIAALCSHDFSRAHKLLGRKRSSHARA